MNYIVLYILYIPDSATIRQVQVNFGGWDAKWDEWLPIDSGRVRPIQCPHAARIRHDGTPVATRGPRPTHVLVPADGDGDPAAAAAAAAPAAPALSRAERRQLERQRREDAAARRLAARRAIAKRPRGAAGAAAGGGGGGGGGPGAAYQQYMRDATARLRRERPELRPQALRRAAAAGWRTSPLNRGMGFVFGSAHQARNNV